MLGASERVHATAVTAGRRCALIRGPSGSGKSDLALRCLALGPSPLFPEPVALVADDQVILQRDDDRLVATCPAALRGRIEIRGVGVVNVRTQADGDVAMVVDLVRSGPIDRLPDPWPIEKLLGIDVPILKLLPFEASAPQKLLAALVMASLPRVISKA